MKEETEVVEEVASAETTVAEIETEALVVAATEIEAL